jgi:hypothetical protein
MNDPLSSFSRDAPGSRAGPDWRTQLPPVRQCHVPPPSRFAALPQKLPQIRNQIVL